jgi:tRNA 2-(methylsulfanyl)-N6-isopentenyladenosine37 hydroxylase
VKLVATSEAWLQLACGDLPTLLIDHAHCEKKAAHTAVRFLF